jgi:hypothetical protein
MASQDGVRDKDSLYKTIGRLMDLNIAFTVKIIGSSTTKLVLADRIIIAKDSGNFMKGSHLSHMMIVEVEKKINDATYVPFNTDNDRRRLDTVMYDPFNITRLLNKPVAAVDIRSCYWTTAHNLGIISDKLFDSGFKKDKEWKEARAVAIGSLNTSVKEYQNIDGVLTLVGAYRRPYNTVRLDIIDTIWKIANEIALELQDSFCMFLTDCFYVDAKSESKVYELLEKYNYKARSKYIFFNTITEKPRAHEIIWSDKTNFNKPIIFRKDNLVSWKK